MNLSDNELLIQHYLDGTLTGEDLQRFQQKLDQDGEFAREVEDYEMLHRGLEGIGAEMFAGEVKEWEQDFQEKPSFSPTPSKEGTRGSFQRYYYAIAAAVTLLIMVWFFWPATQPSQDPQQLFAEYYEPYGEMIRERGDTLSGVKELLLEGIEAYQRREYPIAVERLAAYNQKRPKDHRVFMYLAISHLEMQQYAQAEQYFSQAMQHPDYRQQAQWYQALSFMRANQLDRAMSLLQEIRDIDPPHYQRQRAIELLDRIK